MLTNRRSRDLHAAGSSAVIALFIYHSPSHCTHLFFGEVFVFLILCIPCFLYAVVPGSTPSRTRRLLRSSSRCMAPRPPSTFGIPPSRNPTASASPSSGSYPAPSTAPTSTASKQDGRSGTRQLILPFVKFLLFYWIYYTLSFLLYIPSY